MTDIAQIEHEVRECDKRIAKIRESLSKSEKRYEALLKRHEQLLEDKVFDSIESFKDAVTYTRS